ncbi:MAG: ATP-binding protein [Calditrichia bacterium]
MKILLTGSGESHLQFISKALDRSRYHFEFLDFEELEQTSALLPKVKLIILNTLPFPENQFSRFGIFREIPALVNIPVLALVRDKPPRLRYRLAQLGIEAYLTVPFDKLDLQLHMRNLLRYHSLLKKQSQLQQERDQLKSGLKQYSIAFSQSTEQKKTSLPYSSIQSFLEILARICDADCACVLQQTSDHQATVAASSNPEILPIQHFHTQRVPGLIKALSFPQSLHIQSFSDAGTIPVDLSALSNAMPNSLSLHPFTAWDQSSCMLGIFNTNGTLISESNHKLAKMMTPLVNFTAEFSQQPEDLNGIKTQVQQIQRFGEHLLDQLNFGIVVVDKQLFIRYLNENAATLLNIRIDQALHHSLGNFLDEETVEEMLQTANDPPESDRPEVELRDIQGNRMAVGFTVRPFKDFSEQENGYIISLKDITKSKKVQEEMRRMDRLASLGVMASGIAHEIRNPLAGIKAMVQTFQEEMEEIDSRNEYLNRIIRLVNRMDDLLRTLFSYARPSKPNRRFYEIDHLLPDVLSLVRQNLRNKNIEYLETREENLPRIFVDSAQIQQVLVNLLLNSVDAIQENGKITVSFRQYILSEATDPNHRFPYSAYEKGRQFLELQISDNGCGIPPDILKQIFNPFFTTKSFGTGLGLSIVYQIMKENDGYIFFESENGQGTDCYLYLPAKAD